MPPEYRELLSIVRGAETYEEYRLMKYGVEDMADITEYLLLKGAIKTATSVNREIQDEYIKNTT